MACDQLRRILVARAGLSLNRAMTQGAVLGWCGSVDLVGSVGCFCSSDLGGVGLIVIAGDEEAADDSGTIVHAAGVVVIRGGGDSDENDESDDIPTKFKKKSISAM